MHLSAAIPEDDIGEPPGICISTFTNLPDPRTLFLHKKRTIVPTLGIY